MTTQIPGVKVLSSDEARTRWRDIMDVSLGGGDVVVERYGRPVVAVIPYEDYEALVDALDDLRDARVAAARVAEWETDSAAARPYEEVRNEMIDQGQLSE